MRRLGRLGAVAAAATLLATAIAAGQSRSAGDLGVGKLLVAAKDLPDANFAKSVVLLIQYDQRGAVGLMINHRTEVPMSRVLQDVDMAKRASDPVFIGGPVEMQDVMALLKSEKKPDDSTTVLGNVYLVSTKPPLEKAFAASSGAGDLRVYVGYCGWASGQLENEIQLGGWWIFEATPGLVFDPNPGAVWSRLITRTTQQIAEGRSPAPVSRAQSFSR